MRKVEKMCLLCGMRFEGAHQCSTPSTSGPLSVSIHARSSPKDYERLYEERQAIRGLIAAADDVQEEMRALASFVACGERLSDEDRERVRARNHAYNAARSHPAIKRLAEEGG